MSDATLSAEAPAAAAAGLPAADRSWTRDLAIGLVVLAIAAALPFLIDSRYVMGQIILALVWASVAVQWNLIFGYAGIFSLAQMAIFAIGGYGCAMLSHYFGWSVWVSIPAGAGGAMLASMVMGLACLRLSGVYVALLTYAIAQVIYLLIVTDTECFYYEGASCRQLTGGATGFARFGSFGTREWLRGDWIMGNYGIVLAGFVLTLLMSWFIIRSPMGLAFKALRDNPAYAVARGVNRFHTQLLVFALSAFFTGLTGGLYAVHFQAIGPDVFSMTNLLFVLAIVVVGGVGTFWGPVAGAVLLMLADEAMRETGEFRTLGLGLIIAAATVLLPKGLAGLAGDLAKRLSSKG
ncbi:branched-chain amino acid ABC transporter permease [Albimonas pacifica]|uniref:Amino acid/amide ABC transporter membrane protein 2, HAAT family n=1 Tax=Albimonas pacifica TaxID=1114924 RepID=A0A1I3BMU6_9RHOB|nr:branched-chain amino acid ABC transporter permease [Albimonas pacifica]SFH63664.1 amino acid/amide ABC transporter membrane protein 2, HAAT family [Albimonas pacifica]